MGVETLKDCPSCGSRIAEAAVRCSFCKSSLGRCVGCQAWIIEGTECFDCGKSTAVRVRKAAAAAAPELPKVHFEGSAAGLLPILAVRTALALACAAALLYAVVGSSLDPVTWWLIEQGVRPLSVKTPYLWGAAATFLLLVFFSGTFVRRWRLANTMLYGKALQVKTSAGSILLNLFLTILVLGVTAGLGLPWLYARYRRSLYRGTTMAGRDGAPLDFDGHGEEVLGRFCLSVLLLPLGIATAGFGFAPIAWIWVKWENSNVLAPDRNGQMRRIHFGGTFGAFAGRWMLSWFLTLVTAGLYRPWAKTAEWRWIAQNSTVA